MNTPTTNRLRRGVRHVASALLLCMAGQMAQAQDAAKALNLFQSLIRPGQAAPGNSGGGVAGAVLGAALAPAGNPSAGGGDLFQLLSQSIEQIDEPREIQIGQQLAAVLLGSKPLYPDMAVQRYVNQLGRWISLQSTR